MAHGVPSLLFCCHLVVRFSVCRIQAMDKAPWPSDHGACYSYRAGSRRSTGHIDQKKCVLPGDGLNPGH